MAQSIDDLYKKRDELRKQLKDLDLLIIQKCIDQYKSVFIPDTPSRENVIGFNHTVPAGEWTKVSDIYTEVKEGDLVHYGSGWDCSLAPANMDVLKQLNITRVSQFNCVLRPK